MESSRQRTLPRGGPCSRTAPLPFLVLNHSLPETGEIHHFCSWTRSSVPYTKDLFGLNDLVLLEYNNSPVKYNSLPRLGNKRVTTE